jgi:hypothetical protein
VTPTIWIVEMQKLVWKILGTMILDVEEIKDVRIYPKECIQEMLVWFLMSVLGVLD